MISALGHLAVWAGLYVAAAVVCAAQLAGVEVGWGTLLFAWSTAVFAYLLDRIKARDRWLDPADPVAHPRRYAFLLDRRLAVRTLMVLMGVESAALGFLAHPLGPLVTVATGAGVLAYAGWPRRRAEGVRARVKDVFVVKNLFVAAGITGFAVLLVAVRAVMVRGALMEPRRVVEWLGERPVLVGLVASHLLLRVFADAVLCDIDDEAADREHETQTLPTRVGGERAWLVAMWIRLGLAVSLLAWPVGEWRVRVAWAVVTAVSTVGLRVWRPRRVRDVVDARFAVEAAVVAAWEMAK